MAKATPTNQQLAESASGDPLVNEKLAGDNPGDQDIQPAREETGAERQAKVIGLLREEIANLKDKLKERKHDQVKLLLFRDFLSGLTNRGHFDVESLQKIGAGHQKRVDSLVQHAKGLAEVAFSKINAEGGFI